ncbi:protein GDAP2 homolog [Actinia tenebrosa]|uniref:Protein GDAP2 homolog n=1 Tax=Actinia tenebrosa TaxID=6105 RepID=A0A6P8IVP9_ACTTE|nr:protein GDAP2 homolog [Actinia tenebrosa]
MDPLGASSSVVDITSLPKWSSTPVPLYPNAVQDEQNSFLPTPFPVRKDVNDRVTLWCGDITSLRATAIVNTTNESLSDKGELSQRIHSAAGPELLIECRQQLIGCRTGEAKMSEGYNLPARYVIHTVGPRYNTKYKTAAESALFSCYRNVMRIVRENKLETLGLCVINTPKRGYPPEDGAHIALRTVRRFLEKYTETVEKVAFVVEGAEETIYRKIMPIYFPRNKNEEDYVLKIMPKDIGNEEGEPIIPERQIRISDTLASTDRDDDDEIEQAEDMLDIQEMHVGQHAFAAMQGDHDQMSRQRAHRSPEEMHVAERQRIYQRWLRRAHTEDFSAFRQQKMLYQSGVDFLGRPVVVFVARHFNAQSSDLSKAVAYFVNVLDKIVNREYVVVYFHTHSAVENQPPLSFLKDLYHIVDHKYRRHLKAFYIVHPTLWARVVTWFFTTFTASSIKDKVHFISGIQYLYDWINPDQLDVPAFVLEHDMKENGTNYHTPTSSYHTGSL